MWNVFIWLFFSIFILILLYCGYQTYNWWIWMQAGMGKYERVGRMNESKHMKENDCKKNK